MARTLGWPSAGPLTAPLLVAAMLAATAFLGAPAADASTASLQAEASQLNGQLIQEQLQVNAFERQYEVDALRVAQDNAAVAALEAQVALDAKRVRSDRVRLSQEAVSSYVDAGALSVNQTLQLFSGNRNVADNRSEYESVAIGDTTETLALLHTDQLQLQANQSVLGARAAADRSAEASATAATENARQVAGELSSKEALVTGQLAVAVATTQEQIASSAAAARGPVPPPVAGSVSVAVGDPALPPFLQCVLERESGGDYQAVSPSGTYMGGFQFSQPTWNEAAQLAGLPQLIGVPPNEASKADQDTLAVALYDADGKQPWLDGC